MPDRVRELDRGKPSGAAVNATAAQQLPKATPEQNLAAWAEAPYVLVSASAGTGKTKTLVDRVLYVLNAGLPLERLLVITFTHKAAAELKERLYKAFGDDDRLRPLRLALPQAHVSTIDSFCARMLRENAIDAHVDPAFRIFSAPDDRMAIAELLDGIFHHWYQGRPSDAPVGAPEWDGIPERGSRDHREFLRLVELCGFRDRQEHLRHELEHLLQLARVRPDPEAFVDHLAESLDRDTPPFVPIFADFLWRAWSSGVRVYGRMLEVVASRFADKDFSKHTHLYNVLREAPGPWGLGDVAGPRPRSRGFEGKPGTPKADTALPGNAARGQDLKRIETLAADLPGCISSLREYLRSCDCAHRDNRWKIAFPNLVRGTADVLRAHNDLAKRLLNEDSSPLRWVPDDLNDMARHYRESRFTLETLLALLRQLMRRYEEYKRERGLLDFSDLELRMRRLLSNPPPGLTGKFDMVMVDEFQDINRLQAEIVHLLKPARGRFLVGDIKQCIYQFRLSDPTIFRDLFHKAKVIGPELNDAPRKVQRRVGDAERVRLYMSRNFRSRYPVLQVVNTLFGTIFTPEMIGGGYLAEALRFHPPGELAPLPETAAPGESERRAETGESVESQRPAEAMRGQDDPPLLACDKSGAPQRRVCPFPQGPGWAPVEIHIIEDVPRTTPRAADLRIEAEARLAAGRIQALRQEGFQVFDRQDGWRSLRYGDIAIILRSPGPTGSTYAKALQDAGIPADFGGQDFFEREEVRDFVNLLHILDNAHDDVSLAAVLRSPASDFTDEDLVRLRLAWPGNLSLLAALRATATAQEDEWSGPLQGRGVLEGPDGQALVEKCRRFLQALDRWRTRVQATDLPGSIAAVLEESGLMEIASASESGSGRLGNLEQLLTLARTYCRERDHGLPGLIRHLEGAETVGATLETVVEERERQDAVRILSLHKSKGLEFPVVILSLLGRSFNDQDANNNLLTGEDWIGVDLFDPKTYVKTTTIAHRTLSLLRKRASREEEMRVLYVAFTRAREKLIVTGALRKKWTTLMGELKLWNGNGPVPESLLLGASSPFDWITGTLGRCGLMERLDQPGDLIQCEPGLAIQRHRAQMLTAGPPGKTIGEPASRRTGESLGVRFGEPPGERSEETPGPEDPRGSQESPEIPASSSGQALELGRRALPGLAQRLQKRYAHEPATRWRGKFWVTEIKRLLDRAILEEEREEGTRLLATAEGTWRRGAGERTAPRTTGEETGVPAVDEGIWLHAVLAELDLSRADPEHVIEVAARLASAGRIGSAWVSSENLAPVANFLSSPIGKEMRGAGSTLERETSFSLRLSPDQLAEIWPDAGELGAEEWILVQGQIDALWPRKNGSYVLLDFKSDRVFSQEEIDSRARRYRPQMLLYREAVRRVWKAERTDCWLYFLRPSQPVRIC